MGGLPSLRRSPVSGEQRVGSSRRLSQLESSLLLPQRGPRRELGLKTLNFIQVPPGISTASLKTPFLPSQSSDLHIRESVGS